MRSKSQRRASGTASHPDIAVFNMQQRQSGNWPHHQPRERDIHHSGRHHEVNAHRLELPDEPADSLDTEVFRAGNRDGVGTAGTDRLQRVSFPANDWDLPAVDGQVLARGGP